MTKKITSPKMKSTTEEYVESLSPKARKEFDKGYKEFILSELLLAIMAQDEITVRKLAEIADVSPTIVQAMRSGAKKDFSMKSFFKVLQGLGFNQFMVGRNGEFVNLMMPIKSKR